MRQNDGRNIIYDVDSEFLILRIKSYLSETNRALYSKAVDFDIFPSDREIIHSIRQKLTAAELHLKENGELS